MSLSSALSTAMAGLRANQAALSIVSSNVANAQTPGYIAQSANQIELAGGAGNGASVRINGVNRQLDQYIQSQLRTETSGGAYADQIANILSQLQNVYGTPGDAGTLETAFSNFTGALQALSASSGSNSAQSSVLSAAQSLAQQLNATSLWNANPALSGAGSITVKLPNGGSFDMIANNAISSGQLAADLKLRDQTLVTAQAQVDQLAAALASSLSDLT